jgi:hypothetical protein
MNMKTSPSIALAAGLLYLSPLFAAVFTLTPDTLSDFDTNGTVIGNTGASNPTSTLSDPTSESPNELRFTTSIDTAGDVTYIHNIIGATFNLATVGGITSVDFAIEVSDPGIASDTPLYFGLTQGGNQYLYTEDNSTGFRFRQTSTSYLAFDKNGLGASNFRLFDTPFEDLTTGNPDFSASGDNIQFFLASVSATSSGTDARNTDFRNTELIVNTVAIPEPTSFALLAIAGVAMLITRRGRR